MLKVVDRIIKKSAHKFEFIDLGGGMGIPYEKKKNKLNYRKYNIAINKFLKITNQKLFLNQEGLLLEMLVY